MSLSLVVRKYVNDTVRVRGPQVKKGGSLRGPLPVPLVVSTPLKECRVPGV